MSHLVTSCFILPGIATGPPKNYEILLGKLSDYIGVGIYDNYTAFKISEITDVNMVMDALPNITWTKELKQQLQDIMISQSIQTLN